MNIRIGTSEEVRILWGEKYSPTENYFVEGIEKGNIEFWTIENEENNLVGELYIFWNSVDADEANGKNRAYLCAFRIKEAYRGRKLGKALMKRVLEHVIDKGFNEVTIGVDPENEEKLTRMYHSFGFTDFIKKQHYDYHYLDKNKKPVYFEEPSMLLLNKLNEV
ncbi:GNAT family N-acetyltransferase [Mycoplasmatota bacterium]|nr:GNAT family N-acetyltransferase [Mycoplasmatota bacterium]